MSASQAVHVSVDVIRRRRRDSEHGGKASCSGGGSPADPRGDEGSSRLEQDDRSIRQLSVPRRPTYIRPNHRFLRDASMQEPNPHTCRSTPCHQAVYTKRMVFVCRSDYVCVDANKDLLLLLMASLVVSSAQRRLAADPCTVAS